MKSRFNFADAVLLTGFVSTCIGCALVSAALAWIVGGVLVIAFACADGAAKASLKNKEQR